MSGSGVTHLRDRETLRRPDPSFNGEWQSAVWVDSNMAASRDGWAVTHSDLEKCGFIENTYDGTWDSEDIDNALEALEKANLPVVAHLVRQLYNEVVRQGCLLNPEPNPHMGDGA